jgi:hypothetical protein
MRDLTVVKNEPEGLFTDTLANRPIRLGATQ